MNDTTGTVWCVKHRDGWCATKDNHEPVEGVWNVPTRCGHWVTLPGGIDRREPTCPDCAAGEPVDPPTSRWTDAIESDLRSEFSALLGGDDHDGARDMATDLVAVVKRYWAALNAGHPNPADTEPTAERTYPYTATCDGCAEGPKPVREVDPESQAWGCRECDAIEDAGVAAAGRAAVDAYHAARTRAALMREGDDSRE